MNKCTLFFVGILVLAFRGFSQETKPVPGLFLKGFVIGADTSNTIPLANILNKVNGKRYISNRYGAFGIQVELNDTLSFSVIGYQTLELPVRKFIEKDHREPIKVRLKPIAYKLKEVDVNYQRRKRDSLARVGAMIMKRSPILNDYQHIDSWIGGSSGSILTELLAGGNKKLQEYQKLRHLIQLYREQEAVDVKYTNDLIVRATGLEESVIPEFKKFCNLPNYFILNSNDYDLVLAIRECHKEFRFSGNRRGRERRSIND
ncbi:MAG: carboxypeptidase-like regulatory domain-containing protein [Bacteroidia bacterium]|nr:carboxypeptidase-like regulatory domain-containing protein [Bacteroidia bacterium]